MRSILDVCSQLRIGDRSPLLVDFIGRGNVWINNTYEQSVLQLARYMIYHALMDSAPGQLSVIGYDGDLSGVFAPFSALSAGEGRSLELISDEKELSKRLEYIAQQIQAVQNVIQGRKNSLLDFRDSVQRPIEGYQLVVLSLDMGLVNNDLRAKLSLLLRNGPACGISFLIISTTYMSIQTASGKDINISVEAIAPNITVLECVGSNSVSINESLKTTYVPLPVDTVIRDCDQFIQSARTAQLPTVTFKELHDMSKIWEHSSIDGLSFSVGTYGIASMDITIGDEVNQRHNAIITGAVGQGKSNLISVIIHSLCMRYSPSELQLYLLDFKEGVTFKPFSNIGQDEYLPHAKALGLESDVTFGVAVLEALFTEYQRRMALLKNYSVKSIRELRKTVPELHMPRIVVIIDEFQMMFGDDIQTGQHVAELLEKSVRLFRAAGIHFILASQTLGGNMALAQKRDSIFSQVPIRIALKNSISESQQTLSMNNPAAAFLRPREAIVNLDYGEVSQNRKTVVAFADENLLKPLRKLWWEMAKQSFSAPYVFESEKRLTITNGVTALRQFRETTDIPVAMLGAKISINGEYIAIPMASEPGRNIAIIGTPDSAFNQAVGMMQSIAISLAIQHPKGNARFIFCDFESKVPYEKRYPDFMRIMENAGFFVETIVPAEFEGTIKELMQNESSGSEAVYIFGAALDRWEYEKDPYGQGSTLKEFTEIAPAKNIHFIGWWIKSSSFSAQVSGYGSSDAFNTKVFLRLDERAVQSLTNPFVKWHAQVLVFFELLCFCSDTFCIECRCAGRLVRVKMKVYHQLHGCVVGLEIKQPCSEVNDISMLSAGKAIIMVVCHIQAGVSIIVKGAERLAVSVDLKAIRLCRFPQTDVVFYGFEYIHVSSFA